MNTSFTCILLACVVLAGMWDTAATRKLHLGSCTLMVHTHELRHHFHQIRHNMLTQDIHKGMRLLRGDMMKTLQAAESCCFLRQLLHFYLEKVFSGYTTSQSLHRRTTSVLANSFLSMTKDLRACQTLSMTLSAVHHCSFLKATTDLNHLLTTADWEHPTRAALLEMIQSSNHNLNKFVQIHGQMHCHCSEETNKKIHAIQAIYDKLEIGAASVKAIGELDSLLEWLDSFHTKTSNRPHHDNHHDDEN